MNFLNIKTILLSGLMLLAAAASAQGVNSRGKDPLYLQLYGGINKSANENLPWTEFSGYPWSGGAFVGLGGEFTPLWGMRGALRYNHNKSRNVQRCESSDTWGWNNLGLFLDATFDITDAVARHSEKTSRWNVKAFAGVGMGYTFGFPMDVPLSYLYPYSRDSHCIFGVRAGLTATYQVARSWRVGAELSQTMFGDRFNGVTYGPKMDGRTNLSLGVTYLCLPHHVRRRPAEPVQGDVRLHIIPWLPLNLPEPEAEKVRRLSGRAFIDFVVDRTEIKPDYRRNPQELHRITATIDSALFDPSIQVRSISLHGYASPESPYSHNEDLSRGRVASLRDYLQKRYQFDSELFTLDNTPEDWQNLRDFIAQGNRRRVKGDIWYESRNILETPYAPDYVLRHRDELLRVIDLEMDPDEKELLLKQVGGGEPYRWLLRYVYPGLRHTDYVIEYVVRQYPVQEGCRLIYTHPEALSLNEMFQVANSYPEGSEEWLDALLIAARQYPDDELANLNAACGCIRMRRLTDARRYLSHSGVSGDARYVQDVIDAMEGKIQWTMQGDRLMRQ